MPDYYVERVRRMIRLTRQHDIIRNGDRLIELGTGWLHWEALTLRLIFDIEAVLFDVWDNRQLGGLKNYLRQLGPMLSVGMGLSSPQLQRAQSLINHILRVESFTDLYRLLAFEYVVDGSGSLKRFRDESFQLIVSGGVLEHVKRDTLPRVIAETRRILRPGGWALHSIDTSDHLSHYDSRLSKKLYLSISEPTWKLLFENEVQYINRVQRGDWLELFNSNGFELIDEDSRRADISGLTLAKRYLLMEKRDLECTVLRLAMKGS
jgi:SAM-dependent methyltransferase